MDNDILINQARRLYAALHVEQYTSSIDDGAKFERLDHLVKSAYGRYQRRLNRCVICYQYRLHDCIRDINIKTRRNCPMLTKRARHFKTNVADLSRPQPAGLSA